MVSLVNTMSLYESIRVFIPPFLREGHMEMLKTHLRESLAALHVRLLIMYQGVEPRPANTGKKKTLAIKGACSAVNGCDLGSPYMRTSCR